MNFRISNRAKQKMNRWGALKKPFVFLCDFEAEQIEICALEESAKQGLLWRTKYLSNFSPNPRMEDFTWRAIPVSYEYYLNAFNEVHSAIMRGDSFLLNLTMPTRIETNLTLEDFCHRSSSPYLVYFKNKFVSFSPESFVRINAKGCISSFPMKGTIDADIEGAADLLKNNVKEMAEHHTIVDLIRNDLSMVATGVEMVRFAYLEEIKSNNKRLLQMSSEIKGQLPSDWRENLGNIFEKLLPAGSITGAPKSKTLQIILGAENDKRAFYTGVFGVFDGEQFDSCVLIRFIEQQENGLVYKSGGGITHLSKPEEEYEELINKVYAPFS
ncbi:MAG: aminodeoxychorismate synthase component I [Mangrovibacterium sp.]